jgi:pimeloyl-ACP methyl ester carboxylesterase
MFLAILLACSAPLVEVAPAPRLVGELIELKTDTGTLYGTIDLPSKPGPWPVVLLHAGSGPTDRNGNGPLIATNCYKLVGRALAAEGIAVLRIDKRGIAASAKAMPKEEDIRIDTYAADVIAWTALLRKDSRFTKLGFIGHSEGSLIGQIAAKDAKFDAFVSLCGPGRPLQEVLREQLKKGLSDELYKQSDAVLSELEAGRTVKDTPKELASLFRPSVQPFLISVFKYDPAKLAKEMKEPLLIVSGSTDIQILATDAKRLADANAKAKSVTIDEMNHVLKAIKETNRIAQLATYMDASVPLHPKLMPELVEFFKQSLSGK